VNEALPPDGDGLGNLIGLEWLELGPERVRGRVAVSERITQPYGIVHGGAYGVIAESLCSEATARAIAGEGMAAFGQGYQATFLRPISAGHVNADGSVRHRGRTTWVWDCELSDDEGRTCALVRMTVAVRPRPS
jgi:1,4-dihydroxy-2-naphthoyl-CoA hydrolase